MSRNERPVAAHARGWGDFCHWMKAPRWRARLRTFADRFVEVHMPGIRDALPRESRQHVFSHGSHRELFVAWRTNGLARRFLILVFQLFIQRLDFLFRFAALFFQIENFIAQKL